jgi:hypothetical protein
MAKKKSKESSIEELLQSSNISGWSIVDANNKFTFDGNEYIIDESVKQYTVLNKAKKINGVWNDWTNEASMTTIFCIDTGDELKFFDENLVEVSNDKIKILVNKSA